MTPDGYIDAAAAARLLGVSTATVSRIARRDRWRRRRDGHHIHFVLEDVRTTERNRRT